MAKSAFRCLQHTEKASATLGFEKGKREREKYYLLVPVGFFLVLPRWTKTFAFCIVFLYLLSIPGFIFLTRNSLYFRFASSRLRRIIIYRDTLLSFTLPVRHKIRFYFRSGD